MPGKKKPAKKQPARKLTRKVVVAKRARPTRAKTRPKTTPARSERRRQPETLRLRTAAIGLTVNDLQRSLAWYRDVLGFVVTDEWRSEGTLQGVEMRAGAVEIFLGQDDWKKGRDRLKGEGFRIYGRTVQDVDQLAAVIKARGVVLAHDPKTQPWGERDFGLVDPDGFKITISSGI
jgi:lactoylglutathione lyase